MKGKLVAYSVLLVPLAAVAYVALSRPACSTGWHWIWVVVLALVLSWIDEKTVKYIAEKLQAKPQPIRLLAMGMLASSYVLCGIILIIMGTSTSVVLLLMGFGLLDGALLLRKLP